MPVTFKQLYSWMGISIVLLNGFVHLLLAPDEFHEASYMGILFVLYFAGSIVAAIGITHNEPVWGWLLGGMLSMVALLGYLVSRTVGLPLTGVEAWGPSVANITALLEISFLAPFFGSYMPEFRLA